MDFYEKQFLKYSRKLGRLPALCGNYDGHLSEDIGGEQ